MDVHPAAADGSRASRDPRSQRRSRLAAVAAEQHGQLHRDDLAACGYDVDARRRLLASGAVVRRHPGVVAVAGFAPGLHADAMAAVLAGGPGALLCCRSGAALFGGRRRDEGPLCVSVPRGSRRRHGGVRFHERTRMPVADLHHGVPVCRPEQVVLDCAALLAQHELNRLVDDLVADLRLTLRSLDAHVAANPGAPGIRRLRTTLGLGAYGITRSEAERRLRDLLEAAALEPFELNADVLGRTRGVWFPDARVVVELQSLRYHGTPARIEDDARRALELQAAGIEAMAVTARMVRDAPQAVTEGIAAVVARRRT